MISIIVDFVLNKFNKHKAHAHQVTRLSQVCLVRCYQRTPKTDVWWEIDLQGDLP
jgi:hypothetical protein